MVGSLILKKVCVKVKVFITSEMPCIIFIRFLNISNIKFCTLVVVLNSHEGGIVMTRQFDNHQRCARCALVKYYGLGL